MSRTEKIFIAFLLAAAVSAGILWAFPAATLWYVVLVLLHAGLGVALLGLGLAAWRKHAGRRTPAGTAFWLAFLASAGFGVALMIWGNDLHDRPLFWLHLGFSALLLALLAVWLAGRARARAPQTGAAPAAGAPSAMWRGCGIALCGLVLVATPAIHYYRQDHPGRWAVIKNRVLGYVSSQQETGNSPFAPSDVETLWHGHKNHFIPTKFFESSQECQSCHPQIYREWEASAHHFSSFNNQFYSKSIQYMQQIDLENTHGSQLCAGCHDPAVMLTGYWKTPIIHQLHTPRAQAGLGCVACHGIVHVRSTLGNGSYVISDPQLNALVHSNNRVVQWAYRAVLHLDPAPHDLTFLPRFFTHQTALVCSACHKVHLDVPDNHYRWIRGFDEYDAWQASGVSMQGARSFYYPPRAKNCATCHMPKVRSNDPAAVDGFIRSHRFIAANTALAYVNHHERQLADEEKFLRGAVTTDIFAVVRGASSERVTHVRGAQAPQAANFFGQGEESSQFGLQPLYRQGGHLQILGPINEVKPTLKAGATVRVDVVIRTMRLGHFFPGGTIDAQEAWVDFKALDGRGRPIFWSGFFKPNGKVDPSAHFYRSLLLDAHGHPINKRDAELARSVVYVHIIPPGAADTVHYQLRVPPGTPGPITLIAKLKYRKFGWFFDHFSYAGVQQPGKFTFNYDDRKTLFNGSMKGVAGEIHHIPNLPVVTLSQARVVLPLANHIRATAPAGHSPRDWVRWNDYGIGLLLQGDLTGAEQAFRQTVKIEPRNPDGWLNIGRAQQQEGELRRALANIDHALRLHPGLPRALFFQALVYKTEGHYKRAETALAGVLRVFPHDRIVLNQAGRLRFLQARFRPAIAIFKRTLAIDPENVFAHYNLMLCYRGLGELRRSRLQEAMYERFKAYEAAQAIAGAYDLKHPNANNEAQPVHVHKSGLYVPGQLLAPRAWRGPVAGEHPDGAPILAAPEKSTPPAPATVALLQKP